MTDFNGLVLNVLRGFCYLLGMLIKVDLATALKKLRGSRTQKEVARKAELSPSTWNQYEKARRLPKEESWPKLARGLDCSMEELWEAVLLAYQERTGKALEQGNQLTAAVESLVSRISREVADRVADRLVERFEEVSPTGDGDGGSPID
jgi:transcriptional regulator with XRE-family HTH domain